MTEAACLLFAGYASIGWALISYSVGRYRHMMIRPKEFNSSANSGARIECWFVGKYLNALRNANFFLIRCQNLPSFRRMVNCGVGARMLRDHGGNTFSEVSPKRGVIIPHDHTKPRPILEHSYCSTSDGCFFSPP